MVRKALLFYGVLWPAISHAAGGLSLLGGLSVPAGLYSSDHVRVHGAGYAEMGWGGGMELWKSFHGFPGDSLFGFTVGGFWIHNAMRAGYIHSPTSTAGSYTDVPL